MSQPPDQVPWDTPPQPPVDMPSVVAREYGMRPYPYQAPDDADDDDIDDFDDDDDVPIPYAGRTRDRSDETPSTVVRSPVSGDGPAPMAASDAPAETVPATRVEYQPAGQFDGWVQSLRPASEPADPRPARDVSAGPPAPPGAAIKIGLWGSPQSGKTTYLAALRLAAAMSASNCGSWSIWPLSEQSKQLLILFSHTLVSKRRFPEATVDVTDLLQWEFIGNLAGSKYDRRRLSRKKPLESRFVLDLIDVTGHAFAYEPAKAQGRAVEKALDHMAAADGLIYMFDPIGHRDNRDSAAYVSKTIDELMWRVRSSKGSSQHMPHQLSVCVTKFDHPEVFQQARRMGLVDFDDEGTPRVLDQNAKRFFDALCSGEFWQDLDGQSQGSAEYVRQMLQATFGAGQIEYFVASSIGFWKAPGARGTSQFDPNDFANYHVKGGEPSIRGTVSPINVLEPLISLQQRVHRARATS